MATILKKIKCRVCENTVVSRRIYKNRYYRCCVCGSIWMAGRIKPNYNNKYYQRGQEWWGEKLVDWFSYWDRFKSLNLQKNEKILEIGFGQGKMLDALSKKGYQIWGVEKSKFCVELVKQKPWGKRVFGGLAEIDSQFDVVLMYQVLEHISYPKKYLTKLLKIIKPGGRLVVRIPNYSSWEARWGGSNWYHLDYPNHKILYSELGIRILFEKCGMEQVSISKNMGEYRQVMGYSLLSRLGISLPRKLMIIYQIITIPVLWIFSALMAQHGVIEVVGITRNYNSSK